MRKIPTIFERDWNGDRSRVLDQPNPAAAWVFVDEGVATQKIDGACCMIRDGKLYKRREATRERVEEGITGFEMLEMDPVTAKCVGWVPVTDSPEDRWFREGFERWATSGLPIQEGTYELVGPKVQGNPEERTVHGLVFHGGRGLVIDPQPPRTFDGLREWLTGRDVEGIVWHHPDGRMAKIKGRDFGLKRAPPTPASPTKEK